MKKILLVLLLSCPIWNVLAISGLLKQSTAVNVTVVMIDSTDHVTGKTLLTLTIRESKNGGAFAAITPTVTELEGGVYSIAFTAAHTDTLGELRLRVTAAGADESDPIWQVVAGLPGDNVTVATNLDKTGYSLTQAFPVNFSTLAIDGSGYVSVSNLSTGVKSLLQKSCWFTATNISAQGGTNNSITLFNGEPSTDQIYRGAMIEIYDNTGDGQCRIITDYNGTTKVATVDEDWQVNPDNTSLYRIGFRAPKIDSNGDVTFNNTLTDIWNVTLPSTYTGQKAGALLWKIGNRPNQ